MFLELLDHLQHLCLSNRLINIVTLVCEVTRLLIYVSVMAHFSLLACNLLCRRKRNSTLLSLSILSALWELVGGQHTFLS